MLDIASPGRKSMASVHCHELELNENEFFWGLKARVTQGKKIVYYKSFFFGGIEYSCYDTVYFYKEGEPEPYIGKIIEVWEDRVENRNKMKVLWFFRPIEIPKWLEDESNPAYKEIFLASGKGKGVINVINTLNVILGKCKVLCTSVDKRNPQPSEEDLESAHYFFYRRFDVENYTISEDMDLVIKDFGVEGIFNKQDLQRSKSATGLSVDRQTNERNIVDYTAIPSKRAPKLEAHKDIAVGDALKEDFHEKGDAVMLLNKGNLEVDGDGIRENPGHGDVATNWKETPKMESVKEEMRVYKRLKLTPNIVENDDIVNGFCIGAPLEVSKDFIGNEILGFEAITLGKVKFIDGSPRASERKKLEELESPGVKKERNTGHKMIEVSRTSQMIKEISWIEEAETNENATSKNDSVKVNIKSAASLELTVNLSEDSVKKVEDTVKKVEDKVNKIDNLKKEETNSENVTVKKPNLIENSSKASEKSASLDLQPDSTKNDKEPFKVSGNRKDGKGFVRKKNHSKKEASISKKEVLNSEHISIKKSNLSENSSNAHEDLIFGLSEDMNAKKENTRGHKIIEVTKRPELESNKWFKGLPWDERLQRGYEQGSVILIENFDPSYTSTEVEDIIWNVFAKRCTAKVIPRTAISIPRMGQALLVFKNKEGAEVTLKKLEEDCLMLSNERPLIASKTNPVHSAQSTKFAGHLSVEKYKLQMQQRFQTEDMKKAVATSHCAQPNTIEYVMATEWALLQEKSDRWWNELYKKQEEEIKIVKHKPFILSPEKHLSD